MPFQLPLSENFERSGGCMVADRRGTHRAVGVRAPVAAEKGVRPLFSLGSDPLDEKRGLTPFSARTPVSNSWIAGSWPSTRSWPVAYQKICCWCEPVVITTRRLVRGGALPSPFQSG